MRNRRGDIDWGAIGGLLGALTFVAVLVVAAIWAAQQPTCYGVEPDGEVETLWPCPAPHQDGDRFNITEDQFADREID